MISEIQAIEIARRFVKGRGGQVGRFVSARIQYEMGPKEPSGLHSRYAEWSVLFERVIPIEGVMFDGRLVTAESFKRTFGSTIIVRVNERTGEARFFETL